jgi:hypothetical protein
MKRTLTLAVLVAFLVPALVLAAPDPGSKDRIYFGSPEYDAATAKLVVPIMIENDEPITAIDIPLKFGSANDGIVLDKVDIPEDSRVYGFDFKFSKIDNNAKTVLIGLVSSAFDLKADMAPGNEPVAYLRFTVTDEQLSQIILEEDKSRAPQHTMLLIENRVVDDGKGREVIDFRPDFTATPIPLTATGVALPKEYSLRGNYPNPFNAKTIINFALPKESKVTLDIYNILGQKVKTLVDGAMPAGYHNLEWNGTDFNGLGVSSGVYLYKLKADNFTRVNRMTLLK